MSEQLPWDWTDAAFAAAIAGVWAFFLFRWFG